MMGVLSPGAFGEPRACAGGVDVVVDLVGVVESLFGGGIVGVHVEQDGLVAEREDAGAVVGVVGPTELGVVGVGGGRREQTEGDDEG